MRLHLMQEVITIMLCIYMVTIQSKPSGKGPKFGATTLQEDGITFKIYPSKKNFPDAQRMCEKNRGKLLTIKNHERQMLVDKVLNKWLEVKWNNIHMAKGIWIGLSLAPAKYHWSDGDVAEYFNRITDARPTEQCFEIIRPERSSKTYKWKLDFCRKKQPFICEYGSNPDTLPGDKAADIPEGRSHNNTVFETQEKVNAIETPETTTVTEKPEATSVSETPKTTTVTEPPETTTVTKTPETTTVTETPETTTVTETPETTTVTETPETTTVHETPETTTVNESPETTTTVDLSYMFFGGGR